MSWPRERDVVGDKLTGLQILDEVAIPIPPTVLLREVSEHFPGTTDAAIFRPDLPTLFDPDEIEARSGAVDSVIVKRSDWSRDRSRIAGLLSEYTVLMQPYIAHTTGAIAHYWPHRSRLRMAIASSVADLAAGGDAQYEGVLDLTTKLFTTTRPVMAPIAARTVGAVANLGDRLAALPPHDAWEFELCIDFAGDVWFLQGQPSSAIYSDWESE